MTFNIKNVVRVFWDFTESITFGLAMFVVAYLFLFQPSVVLGMSSFPTVMPNEKVISEKISYKFSSPERGDFVIIESPKNPDVDFIKRIIGLPGEKLVISGGKVFINDVVLSEPYASSETFGELEMLIPEKHYFVMGDNREHSSDSRDFGPIDRDKIIGRVIWRFWPPERFGVVH